MPDPKGISGQKPRPEFCRVGLVEINFVRRFIHSEGMVRWPPNHRCRRQDGYCFTVGIPGAEEACFVEDPTGLQNWAVQQPIRGPASYLALSGSQASLSRLLDFSIGSADCSSGCSAVAASYWSAPFRHTPAISHRIRAVFPEKHIDRRPAVSHILALVVCDRAAARRPQAVHDLGADTATNQTAQVPGGFRRRHLRVGCGVVHIGRVPQAQSDAWNCPRPRISPVSPACGRDLWLRPRRPLWLPGWVQGGARKGEEIR